ncbi:MAG: hypothetical protein VB031_06935 [Eubacteriaceae bacterium]|nr:hypothetical protein [Eubacteriaceae bacterium]
MSIGNRRKSKEINFYLKYNYDPAAEIRKRNIRNLIIPIACVAAAFVVVFAALMIPAWVKQAKTGDYNDYISDPTTVQQYKEAKAVETERNGLENEYKELNDLTVDMAAMPTASRALIEEVRSCLGSAEGTGYTFSSGDGAFVITLQTSNVSELPAIVTRLRQTGEFKNVEYKGYQSSDKKYITTITCSYDMTGE